MVRERFFASHRASPGEKRIVISGEEYHHLVRVTRVREGDEVTVLDGSGGIYGTIVHRLGRDVAILAVNSYRKAGDPPRIDMALALTKAHRLDFAVEKCAEIGLRCIMPFVAQRSVWRGGERETAHKQERLVRKVVAACKQSGNPYFPAVGTVTDIAGLLQAIDRYRAVYLADAAGRPAESAIERDAEGDVLGIVGPEGGLADQERSRLIDAGAIPVTLGPYALRSETAALCLLFLLGRLFGSG